MNKLLRRYTAVLRYGVVGLLGTVLHLALLMVFVEVFQWHPVAGSAAGFVVVLVVSYYLNKYWTFNEKNPASAKQFTRFAVVSSSGLLWNAAIMYIGVEVLAIPYIAAQSAVILVVPVHNYVLNRRWTFDAGQTG